MTPTDTEIRPRRPGGLLRAHDFRMLWLGETTSRLGSAVSGIAVPLIAVETLQASTFLVGLLEAAAWLPWLLVGLHAGALTDRVRRRPVMLACDAVSVLLCVSVPVAAWLGVLTMAHLLFVALLTGVATVFFTTAYQAYLPSLVAKEDLAEGNAKLQGSEQVATIAGPGVGGAIAQAFGAVLGMLVDAATFVVSALCLLRIRREEPPVRRQGPARSMRAEIGEGLRVVVRDPFLRILTVSGSIDNLVLTAVHALLVVFLVRTVGLPAGAVGVLIAADALGGVVGAMVATRFARAVGTGRALLWSALGTAPFGLLIPLTDGGWRLVFFALGLFVPAAGMVASNVIANSFRQSYCPPELRGRVFTSSRFLQFGVIPLGALAGGALGTALGVREALWLLLAVGVLGKFVRLVGPLPRCRVLPTEPPAHLLGP